METITQSEAIRRRYRFLSHFSLSTTLQVYFLFVAPIFCMCCYILTFSHEVILGLVIFSDMWDWYEGILASWCICSIYTWN